MELKERMSVFSELKEYCIFAKENAYIEVTEWSNGEGVDVNISSTHEKFISLTHGEFKAMKKLIKALNK